MAASVQTKSIVERKHPQLPRFVIVPSTAIARWKLGATTVVDVTLNGVAAGRRALKKWDADRWFIDLPEPVCRKAGIDTGDRVAVALSIASMRLPDELAGLLASSASARAAWNRLTPSQQRMLQEHIAEGIQSSTRLRRAERALSCSVG